MVHRAFANLCTIEMFERLAHAGLRSVAAVYIMQADDPGGLHLTPAQKGTIYAFWFAFQSLLPLLAGGFADRYGYKRVLAGAICTITLAYVLMAFARSYGSFLATIILLAGGTAFFKPALQGSIAHILDRRTSSLGWGIFFWIVNVGSFLAPLIATVVLGDPHSPESWRNLFLVSAALSAVNLLLLFLLRDIPSGADRSQGPIVVLRRTVSNLAEPRLLAYLLILSGYWLMLYQLWDLHPNFVTDWVDSRPQADAIQFLPATLLNRLTVNVDGETLIPQQMLIGVNAALIVLLVVPLSWLVRRMRILTAMLLGILFSTAGIAISGMTGSGSIFLVGILAFSIGEMMTAPKQNEYLGLIAPKDKKGLFLGYLNIPVGIGGILGSKLAGFLYGHYGEKAVLALRYLAERTPHGGGKAWDGNVATLEESVGLPRAAAMEALQRELGIDAREATRLLWDTYHPQYAVWLPFVFIGLLTAIALAIFNHRARQWSDMDA